MYTASQNYDYALSAEAFVFDLLCQQNISFTKSAMSPMAQDMGGAFYTFERPVVLPKSFVFPANPVLDTHQRIEGETILVTRFMIAGPHIHTYATFYTPNSKAPG